MVQLCHQETFKIHWIHGVIKLRLGADKELDRWFIAMWRGLVFRKKGIKILRPFNQFLLPHLLHKLENIFYITLCTAVKQKQNKPEESQ